FLLCISGWVHIVIMERLNGSEAPLGVQLNSTSEHPAIRAISSTEAPFPYRPIR
ncbi:hypothetical protein SCLCIDRAFT_1097757, partial [Scleroderma citrinum Foug A]